MEKGSAELAAWIGAHLGWPVFVTPANMGSSVGIHKVKSADGLDAALEDGFGYDLKVLIERSVDAREIELAVLENGDALIIPSPLSAEQGEGGRG